MSISAALSVDEYLTTSYRPDCEYLEGELLERNVGEWEHSRGLAVVSRYLSRLRKGLQHFDSNRPSSAGKGAAVSCAGYSCPEDSAERRNHYRAAVSLHRNSLSG